MVIAPISSIWIFYGRKSPSSYDRANTTLKYGAGFTIISNSYESGDDAINGEQLRKIKQLAGPAGIFGTFEWSTEDMEWNAEACIFSA